MKAILFSSSKGHRHTITVFFLGLLAAISGQQQVSAQEPVELTASNGGVGFGYSASISDDYAIVGAPGANDFAGAAYIYEQQGDGTWIEAAILTDSEAESEEFFGFSSAISGDRVLVGAVEDHEQAPSAGAAFVFERQVDGTWLEVAKLTASDAGEADFFGYSVALSGDRALVGSYEDEVNGEFPGSAFVFERQSDGSWLEVAKLTASDGIDFHGFGSSVSLSGDRALVGAKDADDEVGAAYVFERQTDGSWPETAKLTPDLTTGEVYVFGGSVSLEDERALIGAPDDGTSPGLAFIFERQGDGSWIEVAKLADSQSAGEDFFGNSVALREELAISGAPSESGVGKAGAALVYMRQEDGSWLEVDKLTATQSAIDDAFGISVSLSSEHLLVTAAGVGYVFELDQYSTDVEEQPADFLSNYRLLQNYPNPFKTSTTIAFDVPSDSQLRLVIYDLLGREVASIANGRFVPGHHEVKFDAGDLPGGLYVYRLETSYGIVTKFMQFVK